MMSQTPPIHLFNGKGSFGGFAELDVGDALALALPVLVDLHALHLRQYHHHQLFQAIFFSHLAERAEGIFEIFLLDRFSTNNEESGVWRDVVIPLVVGHCGATK